MNISRSKAFDQRPTPQPPLRTLITESHCLIQFAVFNAKSLKKVFFFIAAGTISKRRLLLNGSRH